MVPIPFVVATGPPRVTIMPSLQPKLPVSRSQHFKRHQSAVEGFSLYPLDALQAKKAITPQSMELVPHTSPSASVQWSPFLFVVAAAAPGVHIMPSLQPKVPISRSQHLKRQQSAVQGFSLYPLDALSAKKGNNPPKRPKRGPCLSHFSEGQCPMVPIPFAVAPASRGVHIMPSLHPELPNSRSQHFKCHQSAARGFSLYPLDALQPKKRQETPQSVKLVPHSSPLFFAVPVGHYLTMGFLWFSTN